MSHGERAVNPYESPRAKSVIQPPPPVRSGAVHPLGVLVIMSIGVFVVMAVPCAVVGGSTHPVVLIGCALFALTTGIFSSVVAFVQDRLAGLPPRPNDPGIEAQAESWGENDGSERKAKSWGHNHGT
jgi:hypothetical protein